MFFIFLLLFLITTPCLKGGGDFWLVTFFRNDSGSMVGHM